jgi:glycine dehydrogenase subunit 1
LSRAYIPLTGADREAMLATIGVASADELFADVPAAARGSNLQSLPPPLSELDLVRTLQSLAAENTPAGGRPFFRGGGAYRRFTPAVVDEIIRRGEFLTSYTPYQAEASQGTLQSAFEFQSMVCALYGMEVANAGMYDGASALAEACLMACRETRRDRIAIADSVNPRYVEVVRTYTEPQGIALDLVPSDGISGSPSPQAERGPGGEVACLAIQSPDYHGRIVLKDNGLAQRCHEAGALLVVSADPMSLALFKPPGELGADIAVGEGQSLGLPLAFGGPYVGLFTTQMERVRQMPGRVVGQTTDLEGRRAFVLTLQAREQHIRRERAVSNICTSEQLIALAVTAYLSSMGRRGLAQVARLCYDRAHYAATAIDALPGWSLTHPGATFFQEFAVHCPRPYAEVNALLQERGIVGGIDVSTAEEPRMLLCVTETNTRAEIDALVAALREIGGQS